MSEILAIEYALKQIGSSIQAYLKGNRAEIEKLEHAIEDIDRELVPVMSRESPEKLLKYLTHKVELTLKLEELKVRKGISIGTLLKGWAPILAPLLAAVMAFAGVLIGASIQQDSAQQASTRDALRRETELVISVVSSNSNVEASTKLEALIEADLITQIDKTAISALAKRLKPAQPMQSKSDTIQPVGASNKVPVQKNQAAKSKQSEVANQNDATDSTKREDVGH